MVSLARGSRRLLVSAESGGKFLTAKNVRNSFQAAAKCKIVEGNNGEKIFTSPRGDVQLPSATIPEYVWKNVHHWPNKIALECGVTGRKYTYSEARAASGYVARSLRNIGLREGDIVAIVLPNLPESAITFLGVLEAEMVATTVNPFYTVDEMTKQLMDSGAKAVVTSAEIARGVLMAVNNSMPSGSPTIVVDDGTCQIPEGTIPFQDLITRGATLPSPAERNRNPDALATLPYSSGTTGLPKGVELTHRNLVSDMVMVDASLDPRILRNSPNDVIPALLPFFHIYGMNGLMLPRLAQGSKLVTMPKFTPEIFLKVLDDHQAIGAIFSGAAPLAESDVERVYKKFGVSGESLTFLQGYGMTECSAVTFLESSNRKYASIGHPICNSEARLVDPSTNRDVSTSGQTGELWVRGPHVMTAYKNNPEATASTVQDGWLKTGDIAYFDDDRDFFITDRLKELVKVKGFQVPPAELEAILRTHPDVEDVAVVGIPDPRSGEVPRAFVLRKKYARPTEDQLCNFLKGKVAEYKELTGGVTFVESIPRNASGKILRIKLKQLCVK